MAAALAIAGLIMSAVASTANTVTKIVNKYQTMDKNRSDYEYQLKLINGDASEGIIGYRQSLEDSYTNSMAKLELDKDSNMSNLRSSYNSADTLQTYQLGSNTRSMKNSMDSAYDDLSMMLARASQEEGSAIQRASLTGFRNTGSNMNAYADTVRQNQYSISKAERNIQYTAVESMANAVYQYGSVEAQKNSYITNMDYTMKNYEMIKTDYENQYTQNIQNMDYNVMKLKQGIKDNSYDGWNIFLDSLGGLLTLGATVTSGVYSIQQQNMQDSINEQQFQLYGKQNEYYDAQLEYLKTQNSMPNTSITY